MSLDQNERILDVLDSKPDSRRIKIKSIASDRNLSEMATEIAQKCKYIHPSRVEEVEQLLIKLNKSNKQKETMEGNDSSGRGGGEPHHESREKDRDREKKHKHTSKKKQQQQREEDKYPPADMESLDDYLELLYQVLLFLPPPALPLAVLCLRLSCPAAPSLCLCLSPSVCLTE